MNNFGLRGRCEQHEDLSRKTKTLEVASEVIEERLKTKMQRNAEY